MTINEYALRAATADDYPAIAELLSEVFGEDPDEEQVEVERTIYEPARTLLAVTTDPAPDLAGLVAAFTRELTVPGGSVPAAHVTMVGVSGGHRRRGLLTRMMHRQLAEVRELGEPLAVLWASEGRIYQRFGYGLAATRLALDIDGEVALTVPPGPDEGRVRRVPLSEAATVLRAVYERVRLDRPGYSSRDDRWWGYVLADPKAWRDGATARKVAVHEGPDGIDGYAVWRIKSDWDANGPKHSVRVRELVASSPGGYRALARHLLAVDLARSTQIMFAAPDEPLQYLVNEPRRLGARLSDALWARIVDLPAALSARRYLAPVRVRLAVHDPILADNTGTWELVGDRDGARCTRTDQPADLELPIAALGSAYLGGASPHTLAAAGLITERSPGALAGAGAAFGWYRAPAATEVF